MTKKNIALIALVAVLAVVYIRFFTDWFQSENIQIYHTVRLARPSLRPGKNSWEQRSPGNPVIFGLDREFEITSIKVFSVAEAKTNKFPHPLWNLVSESNSVPIKGFLYGRQIRGMHTKVEGATPEPLIPGVQYRVFVEAGSINGEHDFETTPRQKSR